MDQGRPNPAAATAVATGEAMAMSEIYGSRRRDTCRILLMGKHLLRPPGIFM
jgi:hypothetical protein